MNNYRESIHNIHDDYAAWKRIIDLDYELLGLADDVFVTPVKYYFSTDGFGIVLSRDVMILSGKNKNKVQNEILRLKNRLKSR
jgi:hypothetical protein